MKAGTKQVSAVNRTYQSDDLCAGLAAAHHLPIRAFTLDATYVLSASTEPVVGQHPIAEAEVGSYHRLRIPSSRSAVPPSGLLHGEEAGGRMGSSQPSPFDDMSLPIPAVIAAISPGARFCR